MKVRKCAKLKLYISKLTRNWWILTHCEGADQPLLTALLVSDRPSLRKNTQIKWYYVERERRKRFWKGPMCLFENRSPLTQKSSYCSYLKWQIAIAVKFHIVLPIPKMHYHVDFRSVQINNTNTLFTDWTSSLVRMSAPRGTRHPQFDVTKPLLVLQQGWILLSASSLCILESLFFLWNTWPIEQDTCLRMPPESVDMTQRRHCDHPYISTAGLWPPSTLASLQSLGQSSLIRWWFHW